MKRKLIFTGALMSTVVLAILAVMFALAALTMFAAGGAFSGVAGGEIGSFLIWLVTGIIVVVLIVIIIDLVFTCMAFGRINKPHAEFKKGAIIAATVLHIIVALYSIYTAVSSTGDISGTIMYIIFAVILIASSILNIVDLSLERKRAAAVEAPVAPTEDIVK